LAATSGHNLKNHLLMLIINADDFGRNRLATDKTRFCHERGSVTSVSLMVFMEDSKRAADLAAVAGIDAGLHLNFTEAFTALPGLVMISEYQIRIARFLTANRFAHLFYHPGLRQEFHDVFQAQLGEFVRLLGKLPSHYDGHHHMHLCANVLMGGLIPRGQTIRRTFSFFRGEKSFLNRAVRCLVTKWVKSRYRSTDFLFSLPFCRRQDRLDRVARLARTANVELETHPEDSVDFDWLTSDDFARSLGDVQMGNFAAMEVG
jgi:chitin disaccharide deacetylase